MNPPKITDVSAEDQENLSLKGRKLWKSDLNAFSNKTGRFEPGVARKRKYKSAYPASFSGEGDDNDSTSGQCGGPSRFDHKRRKSSKRVLPPYLKVDPINRKRLIYVHEGDAPVSIDPKLFCFMAEDEKKKWRAHKEESLSEFYKKRLD
ncbi:hypothetical protein HDU99_002638, partial [Rhizoclosmatium hyalinum]